MNHLNISEIYAYLEEDLPASKMARIEAHLQECSTCRQVLEERRHLLQACRRLPLWTVPPEFVRQVMDRIFPERLSLGRAFLFAASGSAVILSGLFLVFVFSGQGLLNLLVSLNQAILKGFSELAVFGLKFVKLMSLVLHALGQFSQIFWESLSRLSGLPSTELQLALVGIGIMFTLSLLYGVKRLLPIGDKS